MGHITMAQANAALLKLPDENELWTWSGKLAAIVRVAKETFHWRFLEYGTVHMRALGMFRHAKEANQADHENRLNGALQRANSRLNL